MDGHTLLIILLIYGLISFSTNLWFFVESRQIPPHYFFHPAVGVFLSSSSVKYIIKTVVISPTVLNSIIELRTVGLIAHQSTEQDKAETMVQFTNPQLRGACPR